MEDENPTPVLGPAAAGGYVPAAVVEAGTVTGATLGWLKKDQADDTEYWY